MEMLALYRAGHNSHSVRPSATTTGSCRRDDQIVPYVLPVADRCLRAHGVDLHVFVTLKLWNTVDAVRPIAFHSHTARMLANGSVIFDHFGEPPDVWSPMSNLHSQL